LKPAAYTLSSGGGMKTVYAWAKDGGGNISEPASISVDYIDNNSCESVETTVLPAHYQISDNAFALWGRLASIYAEDDDSLVLRMYGIRNTMALTVEFGLENTDVSDLGLIVSSISKRHWRILPSTFRRTVYAYNHAQQEWDLVDGTTDVGDLEAVRSEISLVGGGENVHDYLIPDSGGDNLRFRLKIELCPDHFFSLIHEIDLVQLVVTHLQCGCGCPP
jgi:hypothetical protein